MTYTDISIDLETLSLKNFPYILTAGLVAFNRDIPTDPLDPKLVVFRGPQPGAHIDPSTVSWWMEQSREARAEAFASEGDRYATALQLTHGFIARNPGARVWVNGVDHIWLGSHFEASGMTIPWKYNAVRELRTMYKEAVDHGLTMLYTPSGVGHSVLDDAINQARYVQEISAWMRTKNNPQ